MCPSLDERDKSEILQSGTSEHYLETLEATLDIYTRSVVSEAYVNRMVRDARQSIDDTSGEVVLDPPSAMSVIQLRQLLLAGKSAAWEAAAQLKDPSIDQARDIAFAIVRDATAALEDTRLASSREPSMAALSAPELSSQSHANALEPQSEDQDNKSTYDPNLLKLVERINAEKDRDHIKEDTRKQLVSQARLFIAATGIERVTEINQGHLKYYKSVLQKLPKSYGKSSKDSERTVDELLARASGLPKDIGHSRAQGDRRCFHLHPRKNFRRRHWIGLNAKQFHPVRYGSRFPHQTVLQLGPFRWWQNPEELPKRAALVSDFNQRSECIETHGSDPVEHWRQFNISDSLQDSLTLCRWTARKASNLICAEARVVVTDLLERANRR